MQKRNYRYLDQISVGRRCDFYGHLHAPALRDPQSKPKIFYYKQKTVFDTIFEQKRQKIVLDF